MPLPAAQEEANAEAESMMTPRQHLLWPHSWSVGSQGAVIHVKVVCVTQVCDLPWGARPTVLWSLM